MTSNAAFGRWTKTFANPRLCVAIVGQFTSGGNIIDTQHRLLPPRPHHHLSPLQLTSQFTNIDHAPSAPLTPKSARRRRHPSPT
jgi:hypothetical protein